MAQQNRNSDRHLSHALIETWRYSFWPFFIKSALLLDLSENGFKAEFTGNDSLIPGKIYCVSIPIAPLLPLGVKHNQLFTCKAMCRWFDQNTARFGGEFMLLGNDQKNILAHLIDALAHRVVK